MNYSHVIITSVFLAVYLFGFSLWEASAEYHFHLTNRYAGRMEFLTNLGLLLTITTSVMSLLAEWQPANLKLKQLWHFFLGLSFPLESVIFLLYWSLRYYDRGLVSSREMLARGVMIPLFTDLSIHFFPAIGLYIELLIFAKEFISSRAHSFSLIAFNNAYMIYAHVLYHLNNKDWVYPLLGELSERQHIILVMITTSLCMVFYYIGNGPL
jgi:FAR-17a/AIG1-like protein